MYIILINMRYLHKFNPLLFIEEFSKLYIYIYTICKIVIYLSYEESANFNQLKYFLTLP